MKKPVAIPAARGVVPARQLLLFALVAAFLLVIVGAGHAETRVKTGVRDNRATAAGFGQGEAGKPKTQTSHASALQLVTAKEAVRGAEFDQTVIGDDVVGAVLYSSPPALADSLASTDIGRTTVGIAPAGVLGAKAALPDKPRGASQRATYREWYPEAHNYLRPYRYRWRYWTPG